MLGGYPHIKAVDLADYLRYAVRIGIEVYLLQLRTDGFLVTGIETVDMERIDVITPLVGLGSGRELLPVFGHFLNHHLITYDLLEFGISLVCK